MTTAQRDRRTLSTIAGMKPITYIRGQALPGIQAQRIAILNGTMGTLIQRFKLNEAQYRGERIEVASVAGVSSNEGSSRRSQFQGVFNGERIDEFGLPLEQEHAQPSQRGHNPARERAVSETGEEVSDFFAQLATHWKKNYAGWTAHVLTPDLKLPNKMRLKESRRVPMWNGPIECRLFRFDMVAGSARRKMGVE